jgi:hypothetical protein
MTDSKITRLAQLLAVRPAIHTTRDGQHRCIGLHSSVLSYLYDQLHSGMVTLETGCGLSTLVFALAGCQHYSVCPNSEHILETRKGADRLNIDVSGVTFITERSEVLLPNLTEPSSLDVV